MIKPFKTTLLDQRLRQKQRENEKLRQQTLRRVLDLLPQLATEYRFNHAYVFGSVTKKGRFSPYSDIDIAIEGLDNQQYFKFMADRSGRLEREVDVIQLEKHRLREEIKETCIEWNKLK
jgi:uncharacterized protein